MKSASSGFQNMLATAQQLVMADLYTITLQDGTVLHYTDAPQNITVNGHTFLAPYMDSAPGFSRQPIKLELGLQAGTIEVDLHYDTNTLIDGQLPGAFAHAGGFDRATIQIDKFLSTGFSNTSNGTVNMYTGIVSDIEVDSTLVKLNVASKVLLLNTAWPRNYFLPQCNHALFDSGCTLSAGLYAQVGSVSSGTQTVINTSLTQADGYFALGYVTFTSGVNNGLTRMIKSSTNSGGALTLMYPLPVPCNPGDAFKAYPGCDKSQNTCTTKFNNLTHFRGYPYVPTPETLELGQNGSPPGSHNAGSGAGMGGGGISRGGGGLAGRFEQL